MQTGRQRFEFTFIHRNDRLDRCYLQAKRPEIDGFMDFGSSRQLFLGSLVTRAIGDIARREGPYYDDQQQNIYRGASTYPSGQRLEVSVAKGLYLLSTLPYKKRCYTVLDVGTRPGWSRIANGHHDSADSTVRQGTTEDSEEFPSSSGEGETIERSSVQAAEPDQDQRDTGQGPVENVIVILLETDEEDGGESEEEAGSLSGDSGIDSLEWYEQTSEEEDIEPRVHVYRLQDGHPPALSSHTTVAESRPLGPVRSESPSWENDSDIDVNRLYESSSTSTLYHGNNSGEESTTTGIQGSQVNGPIPERPLAPKVTAGHQLQASVWSRSRRYGSQEDQGEGRSGAGEHSVEHGVPGFVGYVGDTSDSVENWLDSCIQSPLAAPVRSSHSDVFLSGSQRKRRREEDLEEGDRPGRSQSDSVLVSRTIKAVKRRRMEELLPQIKTCEKIGYH